MLACSPRSHEVTLRASAYALSRASRRRRIALFKRCYMIEFKPVKSEKTVISIRLDSNTLKEIDELSGKTDISRNELIVQCIDFALKHLKQ